jgi:DNA-binding NtrC family response regulator
MPATILIVDDDADLRQALAAILSPSFAVVEAANGAQALELIRKQRPALVLLDMSMPGMNGLETLAAAKAAAPNLLVVMLTSRQEIEIAAQALTLGAREYVTKPFDADYIRAEVARLIGPPEAPRDRPWTVVS